MYNPEKKFLFIHPQKCAGTSLRHILRNEYSEGVISDELEPKGSGHWRAAEWANHIGPGIKNYYKFAVVRNPWDRAVSYYHHLQKHKDYKQPFWKFILNDVHIQSINYAIYPKLHIKGKYIVDDIIRQEHFESDLEIVMGKLGIADYEVLNLKHDTNRPSQDYREYYDQQQLIDQIASLSHFEIEKYGYEF